MAILTRDALLNASDLKTKEVHLPTIGGSVMIRSLPAEYSNAAVSESIRVSATSNGEQVTRLDNGTLELLQVYHGLVEPKLESVEAVRTFAKRCGPAFKTLVREIVELSDLTEEAAQMTAAAFPGSGDGPARGETFAASDGSSGPAVHARIGA